MFPYQIYQGLADQHIRDLQADARRHNLLADARRHQRSAARLAQAGQTPYPSRRQSVLTRLLALVHPRAGADTRSETTSAPAAGPMGCIA